MESLRWYTGGNFDKLNEALRKDLPLTEEQEKHLKELQRQFEEAPEIKVPLIVYKSKNSRTVYSNKAFVSTSLSFEEAKKFSSSTCCILEIIVTPGSKVLYLHEVSRFPEEQEVLLNRNGTLTVTQTEDRNGMTIIKCVYLPGEALTVETEKELDRSLNYFETLKRIKTVVSDEELELYEREELPEVISEILKQLGIKFNKRELENLVSKM